MSFADLDGLCLQRVLRFVTSALELARLDAVAKPQHGVTAVAESERRVRAMAIVAPAKRALRRGELRFSISPGFPYSQGPSGDEGAPDEVYGDDLETLLQRAVSWAGGWHAFLAARVGLLETRPPGADGVELGDGLTLVARVTLPVHVHTPGTEPLLLWELRRDGVTMHTELAPVGMGLRQDEHTFVHVPWASCLGDSCAAYAARTDADGNFFNSNGPVHRKGGHDRFHISVPASDRAIWCARVSLLAPNTRNGCCETLIHELEFDSGGFATSPQFRREDSRTVPEMADDDHMGGGSTHTGLNGPYCFTMLAHFWSPFFDFDLDESESEEAPPADDTGSDVPGFGSPEFQVWAVVDYEDGTELNELGTAFMGHPVLQWQSLLIHLNFRLLLDHRTLDAMISRGNRIPRKAATQQVTSEED